VPEVDDLDDLGTFEFLRGIRDRAVMLELRHRDGRVTRLIYAWLRCADYDPSDGITLNFGGETVKITGRNLNVEVRPNVRLFAGIVRHRVPWIQEADEPMAGAGSMGISVHADMEARNQECRVFYAFQLSWSADQQMQAFGRVHRSNQSSAPIIRLVLLDLETAKQ
jgi:hypothetical protein